MYKRPRRRNRRNLEKSASEPNLSDFYLSDHFTPRFPNNIQKLVHEYVTVDDLQFYRKKPSQVLDDSQYKSSIVLYDDTAPITPFSDLKTEYKRGFGGVHQMPAREKVHGQLNQTTGELLEALRDHDSEEDLVRATRSIIPTAKVKGELHIDANDEPFKTMLKQHLGQEHTEEATLKTRTLKLRGDIVYVPKIRVHSFERSQSIPEITFRAEFHGRPNGNSFEVQGSETSSSPLNQMHSDARAINVHRVSPIASDSPRANREMGAYVPDFSKSRNHSGNSDDSTKRTRTRWLPNPTRSNREIHPKDADSGNDYRPQHWSTSLDIPPPPRFTKSKTTNQFEFFEIPANDLTESSPSPLPADNMPDFSPRVAIVQPSVNTRAFNGVDFEPFYCQPEVRRLKKEMLIRNRPPSPSKTLSATMMNVGDSSVTTEEDDNKIYNERSHIVTPEMGSVSPEIKVIVDDVDDNTEVEPSGDRAAKFGRRSRIIADAYVRGLPKASDSEQDNVQEKPTKHYRTISSDLTEESDIDADRPFVILKEPCTKNKWLKPSWYF